MVPVLSHLNVLLVLCMWYAAHSFCAVWTVEFRRTHVSFSYGGCLSLKAVPKCSFVHMVLRYPQTRVYAMVNKACGLMNELDRNFACVNLWAHAYNACTQRFLFPSLLPAFSLAITLSVSVRHGSGGVAGGLVKNIQNS